MSNRRFRRCIARTRLDLTFILMFAALTAIPVQVRPARAADPFVVDRTDDADARGCNTTAADDCSLRGAINKANEPASGPYNSIRFDPTINWETTPITLRAPLPPITSVGTWIDGSTPGGRVARPRIDARLANGGDVITIAAESVTISRMAIFNTDPDFNAIRILSPAPRYPDTADARIAYNYLGTPFLDTCPSTLRYGAEGVRIDTNHNADGPDTTYIYGNVIGCHRNAGIALMSQESPTVNRYTVNVRIGENPSGTADGNWIGVSPSGVPMPNGTGIFVCRSGDNTIRNNTIAYNESAGVSIPCSVHTAAADRNLIGGDASRRNFIYANAGHAIHITGPNAANTVQGNFIGVDAMGRAQPNGRHGVVIEGEAQLSIIGGDTTLGQGNLIAANRGNGVQIDGQAFRNVVQGNIIGADQPGAAALPNRGSGVVITGGAHDNRIGGDSYNFANLISGNLGYGVHVSGATTRSNSVVANRIGTTIDGASALANGHAGIFVENATNANLVITANTISGNTGAGVSIANSARVTLINNYIGLNQAGSSALPNGQDGVVLAGGARDNVVGGMSSADRNFIAGNTGAGVMLRDAGTSNNRVGANFIGLNLNGTAAVPNRSVGIAVIGASGNVIGGGPQYISGNGRQGIYVTNASRTTIDDSNYIGTGFGGTRPVGNGLEGIMLDEGATGAEVRPYLVAYNGGAGIALVRAATGNRLLPHEVRDNGGLAIDLNNDGPTANDSGDGDSGPNTLLNKPVITSSSGGTISGTACSNCWVYIYRAIGDPGSPGGGALDVGIAPVDALGTWRATLPAGLTAADVTLLAVQAATRDTSELTARPQIFVPMLLR